MHNQNRTEYKARLADPAVSAKLAGKASQWNALTRELLSRRRAAAETTSAAGPSSPPEVPPSATLQLIEKLLTVNPDPSHLWNYRRELLLLPKNEEEEPSQDGDTDTITTKFVLEDELKLTGACLQRNPKAYAAWYHRKWTVRHWLLMSSSTKATNISEEERSALLQTELGLCASFLDKDERNFHCWNYRRFVVAATLELPVLAAEGGENVRFDGSWDVVDGTVMGAQIAIGAKQLVGENTKVLESNVDVTETTDEVVRSEFEYTFLRIETNFSNCSAFHYRSKLLDWVLDADLRDEGISRNEEGEIYQTKLDMARGELEMVQSAVFTEPDDQTAWWYHRFVVAWARPASISHWTDQDAAAEAMEAYAEVLEEEKASIRELVDAEGGKCKWGLLALHMLLTELGALDDVGTDEDKETMREEANGFLDQLIILDPDRSTRYNSMRVIIE